MFARTICRALAIAVLGLAAAQAQESSTTFEVDPVTRHVHVTYFVPGDAPDEVLVRCTWSPPETDDWRPAKVTPFVSETALALVPGDVWGQWVAKGEMVERRAAGLERTVVFNSYPEARVEGKVDIQFRIEILLPDGDSLATHQIRIQADNSDVVYVEDWTGVFQKDAVHVPDEEAEKAAWTWHSSAPPTETVTFGNVLRGDAGLNRPLPQLSYPLDLKGDYAVFVYAPGAIRVRLTGDERADRIGSRPFEEILWRWTAMDRQHLVIQQPHRYTGWAPGTIDYVKFVPLTGELVERLDAPFSDEPDKFVATYWEPYSYAFHDNVQNPAWHRAYLSAFQDARVSLVDMQVGRFGAKVVYESRLTDQLLYATRGDPIGTIARPETDGVGRMQQYTNTLETTLQHGQALGLHVHANFGASNCYPGSPLQGDFSKAHPDWMRGSALRFEVPEVKAYVLALYRETLQIGAPGVSIDFCRYPGTIDAVETCNSFLRDLRGLADEFSGVRDIRVPVLVRFPGAGVRRANLFDYATWAKEGWVDYLCPSNIQGRHLHIDMAPYFDAVKGAACKLLPALDGLHWGQPLPGPFLWRVAQVYGQGAPGVYVYQADARILGAPSDRRCMRLIANGDAVRRWWDEDRRLRPSRSKGIYMTTPAHHGGWCGWQRLRVWVEGVEMGPVEMYLDDELVTRADGPPYLLGTEDSDSDKVIPSGPHTLRVRVQDGDGWLEQSFSIDGA